MRHPTPTALKIANGETPQNEFESMALPGAPAVPTLIQASPEALVHWNSLMQRLTDLGLCNQSDSGSYQLWTMAKVIQDAAWADIQARGHLVVSPQGQKKNPSVTVFNEQALTLRTLESEMGLTAASRTKIKSENPDHSDPLTQLLRSKPAPRAR